MGLLTRIRKFPVFHKKDAARQGAIASDFTFDLTDEELSIISSADEFDRLFAERTVKGLLPPQHLVEEESAGTDGDETFLLGQSPSYKDSRFSTVNRILHVITVEEDITQEYEPPQFSPWYHYEGTANAEMEVSRVVTKDNLSTVLTIPPVDSEKMIGDAIIERGTGEVLYHNHSSSGNLGHAFIDELPTLYEDDDCSLTSASSEPKIEVDASCLKMVRREDEMVIRARWDYALECMSSMGLCVDDITSKGILTEASFSFTNSHPSSSEI